MTWREREGWFWKNYGLVVILALGALHGLLYVFLVPPWEHYDEPTHFEYAWLIANRPGLPREGDYDQDMRRQVAASMLEHGFFRDLDFRPDLISMQPIWIGFSELRHPPAYYWLVALPLRLIKSTDITFQLYVSRLVSMFLLLVTIVAAWGTMTEIVPAGHSLRWMVPLSMVLLPAYTDLMTSVNNDAGATAIFCLFLWGCLRLLRRGFSFLGLVWVTGTALLGVWTKNTLAIAIPLGAFALVFTLLPGRLRGLAGWLLMGAGVAAALALFAWGDAALWYRATFQPVPTRVSVPNAPLGKYAIQLQAGPNDSLIPSVRQFIPAGQFEDLRGEKLSLGVWMWATQPIRARTPILSASGGALSAYREIELGTQPAFYAITTMLPENTTFLSVRLEPFGNAADSPVTVFYNGLVLAEGTRPLEAVPQFSDPEGEQGTWGGQPFRNLLRNASVSAAWPWVRPWADTLAAKSPIAQPSVILASAMDWQAMGWYYQAAGDNLFRSFWAKFGWGQVYLMRDSTYPVLALFTLAGVAGAALALWRNWSILHGDMLLVLGVALAGLWGPAVTRGVGDLWSGTVYIPVARYAYPAIVPTVLLLNTGWLEICRRIPHRRRIPASTGTVVYFLLFLGLDAMALYSLLRFFYGS